MTHDVGEQKTMASMFDFDQYIHESMLDWIHEQNKKLSYLTVQSAPDTIDGLRRHFSMHRVAYERVDRVDRVDRVC